MSGEFGFADLFARDLPPPAARFAGYPKFHFIGGNNDPEQIPGEALAEAAAAVIRREAPNLAWYTMAHGPLGYRGLRELVVQKSRDHRGMSLTPEEVLITSGSLQGLDLVNQLLVERGDTVIFEEFSYEGSIQKILKRGAKLIGAPLDSDGLRIDALAGILADCKAKGIRPKYIYTIPTVQNPTGSILPLERREALVALARSHGVPIFEDECYADLTWRVGAPSALFALGRDCVIHIGSFSKTLSPAVRLGYVIAEWNVLSQLISLRTDGGTGAIDQMVVAEYFRTQFEPHVRHLTGVLEDKLDTMVEAVAREFGTAVEIFRPRGGIYLWLKFPDAVDTAKLLAPAAKAGLVFNAGSRWACDPDRSKSFMRLCFATPSKETIREGVATLARVCFEETGIPERSGNVARTG